MVSKEDILNRAMDAIENELTLSFIKQKSNYLLDPATLEQSERRLIRDMISRSIEEALHKEKQLSSITDKTSLLIYANESGRFKTIEDKLWNLTLDKHHHPEKYLDIPNEMDYSFISHHCTQQLIVIKDLIAQIKPRVLGYRKPKSDLQIINDHRINLELSRKQPYKMILTELELIDEVNNLIIYESNSDKSDDVIDELPLNSTSKINNPKDEITENVLIEYSNELNQLSHIMADKMPSTQSALLQYLISINKDFHILVKADSMIERMKYFYINYNKHNTDISEKMYLSITKRIKQIDESINQIFKSISNKLAELNQLLENNSIAIPQIQISRNAIVNNKLNTLLPNKYSVYLYLEFLKEICPSVEELHNTIIHDIKNNEFKSYLLDFGKIVGDRHKILKLIRIKTKEFDDKNYLFPEKWHEEVEMSRQLLDDNEKFYNTMLDQLKSAVNKQLENYKRGHNGKLYINEHKLTDSNTMPSDQISLTEEPGYYQVLCQAIQTSTDDIKNISDGIFNKANQLFKTLELASQELTKSVVDLSFGQNSDHKDASMWDFISSSNYDLTPDEKNMFDKFVRSLDDNKLNQFKTDGLSFIKKSYNGLIFNMQDFICLEQKQYKILALAAGQLPDSIIVKEMYVLNRLDFEDKLCITNDKMMNDFIFGACLDDEDRKLKQEYVRALNELKTKISSLRQKIISVYGSRIAELNKSIIEGETKLLPAIFYDDYIESYREILSQWNTIIPHDKADLLKLDEYYAIQLALLNSDEHQLHNLSIDSEKANQIAEAKSLINIIRDKIRAE